MNARIVSSSGGDKGRRAVRRLGTKHRRIRAVIVDDSPVVVKGLERFSKKRNGFEVVGCAGTGVEAVEEVGRLRPDLVVMDIQMPEMDGVEATRRIKAEKDAPVVIMLTLEDSAGARAEAKKAGADDFVSKAPNVYSALEAAIRRALPRMKLTDDHPQ